MQKKKPLSRRTRFLIVWLALIVLLLALIACLLAFGPPRDTGGESIKDVMRDGVLHEHDKINLFGLAVNPALLSAYAVTALLLLAAALLRIFAIPRFRYTPTRGQAILEKAVTFFSDMARHNSPAATSFVGAYIFSAGAYIFFGTLFELCGVSVYTLSGGHTFLPAPLSDINAAIAMGCLSYLVILGGGLVHNGARGVLGALKDFSLPLSMSFRLFGALLSGLLVTELVYYYVALSFVLPVVVGVLFTLLHALIQTYVLATLVSMFYGEAAEPRLPATPKEKKVH